jgi:hypothetical protein
LVPPKVRRRFPIDDLGISRYYETRLTAHRQQQQQQLWQMLGGLDPGGGYVHAISGINDARQK